MEVYLLFSDLGSFASSAAEITLLLSLDSCGLAFLLLCCLELAILFHNVMRWEPPLPPCHHDLSLKTCDGWMLCVFNGMI